jgi:MoxR-like ATPase
MKSKPIVIDEEIADDVQQFNQALNQIGEVLIDRSLEIEAVKLAILTKSNLMLEGPPGTAKSLLADELFKRIEGAVLYKKMLMKGTQPDELFGPMLSKKYREEAIWQHNIEGMLPTAHFAFLDEVYRASDMVLPATLNILNEREFVNGLNVVKCPLITAIGTTNFTTEDDQLKAFHDRWVIKIKVQPLDSPTLRLKMLRRGLNARTQKMSLRKVHLDAVRKIHRALRRVDIDEEYLELYEEIVSAYRKRLTPSPYISDRRLRQALNLALAASLLNDPSAREIDPEHLISTVFGITIRNEESQDNAFTSVVAQVLKDYKDFQEESKVIRQLEEFTDLSYEEYSPRITKKAATTLLGDVKETLEAINTMTAEEKPKKVANQERLIAVVNRLTELAVKLTDQIK